RDRAGNRRRREGRHPRRGALHLRRSARGLRRSGGLLPRRAERGVIERAVAAIRAGKPVVLPTDTVYGLCADPSREAPAREVARLTGREERQPSALIVQAIDIQFVSVTALSAKLVAPS